MNPKLQRTQDILRRLHLLNFVERIRYWISVARHHKRNTVFKKQNPDFPVPPKYLAYDAYSAPDWPFYERSGEERAKFIANLLQNNFSGYQLKRILEWGCGPGRIVRHLKSVLDPCVEVYGSDYNPETIEWCRKYIGQVTFVQNALKPPLPFEVDFFDCVYALSVLTHLSEMSNYEWIPELMRVVKPRGLIILTTKGDYYYHNILLAKEKKIYDSHGIVVRGRTQEGKKMYGTFHSPKFMRDKLLNQMEFWSIFQTVSLI